MGRLPTSLVDCLRRHVEAFPERTVYTCLYENGEQESLTFDALDRRARSLAAALLERARPGDRAVLLYPHGLEFIAAFMACLYAGVIAVPAYPPKRNRSLHRLQAIIDDATPAAILTVEEITLALGGANNPRRGNDRQRSHCH